MSEFFDGGYAARGIKENSRSTDALDKFDSWYNTAGYAKGYKELPALYYEIAKEAFLLGISISHVGEGATTPPFNGESGSYARDYPTFKQYEDTYRAAKEWLEEEHGDGNDIWVNPIEIRNRIVNAESGFVSAKRALNDTHNTLMRLVDAVKALQDPKGHIFHANLDAV